MRTMDLEAGLDPEDIQGVIKRYGFARSDLPLLTALARVLRPLARCRAYYIWKRKEEPVAYEDFAVVFLSLGEGVDALQEVYLEREAVSEGYMIDCLASEWLAKAYGECVARLQSESGKQAVKIDFLGDTYPLSLMEKWYGEFAGMPVTFNAQYVLRPKKSVAFLLPMEAAQEGCREKAAAHICKNCGNENCLLREKEAPVNYGYRRIFGEKKHE